MHCSNLTIACNVNMYSYIRARDILYACMRCANTYFFFFEKNIHATAIGVFKCFSPFCYVVNQCLQDNMYARVLVFIFKISNATIPLPIQIFIYNISVYYIIRPFTFITQILLTNIPSSNSFKASTVWWRIDWRQQSQTRSIIFWSNIRVATNRLSKFISS